MTYSLSLTYMGVGKYFRIFENEDDIPVIEDGEEIIIDGQLYYVFETNIIHDFDLGQKRIILTLAKGSNKEG